MPDIDITARSQTTTVWAPADSLLKLSNVALELVKKYELYDKCLLLDITTESEDYEVDLTVKLGWWGASRQPILMDAWIDWGDGSPVVRATIEAYKAQPSTLLKHTYAKPKSYTILIFGEEITWNDGQYSGTHDNNTDAAHLRDVLTGVRIPEGKHSIIKHINRGFFKHTKLRTIPGNLLESLDISDPGGNAFTQMFQQCSVLNIDLPEHFFDSLKGLTAPSFSAMFRQCPIKSLPENLFAPFEGCTSIALDQFVQYDSQLKSIPENLFAPLAKTPTINLQYFLFYGTGITDLPPTLIPGDADAITNLNMGYSFCGCTAIKTIPDTFLSNIKSPSFNMTNAFQYCTALTDMPKEQLLHPDHEDSANVNFTMAFTQCNKLKFCCPLWDKYSLASHAQCYKGDLSATNYFQMPSDWKT